MIYKLKNLLVVEEQHQILIKVTNGLEECIPIDEANTDYQEYIRWTKASPKNVAEPADE
jgi:hypothetical protein